MLTSHLPPIAPLPATAAELQSSLRRRRQEKAAVDQPAQPAAETQPAQPQENKPMPTYRTKLDPQEYAHLEALIRHAATDEELADWRKPRQIHHKSFTTIVRDIRRRIEAIPSPMATQIAALEPAAPAAPADEPPAAAPTAIVSTPAPARPAQIDPVIHWLTTLRAMRDELAAHGVTVAGSLRIEIEL